MKKIITIALTFAAWNVSAQESLTPEVLAQLQSATSLTGAQRAIGNALQAGGINAIALVPNNQQTKETYFSVEVSNTGITDQKSSGRCWLFTGLNVLRHQAMKKLGTKNFTFSQVYLFFYDQLEKSNLFLQSIIDTRNEPLENRQVQWLMSNPLSDGGTYTGVADLVSKYGLVPSDVMAETYVSDNTSEFNGHLKRKLREIAINLREQAQTGISVEKLEAYKVNQLQEVYRLLTLAYGAPVKEFTWAPRDAQGKLLGEPKKYTPLEFYHAVCPKGDDLQRDYVMLMNDPSRPFHQVYEIDMDRHVYDGHNWLYVNLPIEELAPLAIASLKDSCQMYFSCDVGKQLNRKTGLLDVHNYDYESLLGTQFGMTKKQRIETHDSGSSHAMTLMAVDLDAEGQPTKWKVENSWGATYGYQGHLIMTHEWFCEYMFRVVVNKRYCTSAVLGMLKQKPVRLPAWDP
ncbi:MAG: C1 family peptidase, partial [Bacteroidaceae bacterium]|nr:C1 family peptidase [Bacteroidaceae bacterium]